MAEPVSMFYDVNRRIEELYDQGVDETQTRVSKVTMDNFDAKALFNLSSLSWEMKMGVKGGFRKLAKCGILSTD